MQLPCHETSELLALVVGRSGYALSVDASELRLFWFKIESTGCPVELGAFWPEKELNLA